MSNIFHIKIVCHVGISLPFFVLHFTLTVTQLERYDHRRLHQDRQSRPGASFDHFDLC